MASGGPKPHVRRAALRLAVATGAWAMTVFLAAPAQAHGFFQRYGLPVPLWLYLLGAGATVAVSFVLVAWFLRAPRPAQGYARLDLLRWRLGRALAHPVTTGGAQVFGVAVYLLLIVAGLFGNQDPFKNIAPTLVWVIWWVGLAYVCTLIGNLWVPLNPWRTLFGWAEWFCRRALGRNLGLGRRYPDRLGVWPAVGLFVIFAWMELIWHGAEVPAQLAAAALLYSALAWTGMFVFGREAWLRGGEVFAVAFGLLARFAPTEVRVRDPRICADCPSPACRERAGDCVDCHACFARAQPARRALNLRPYAVGLLADRPVHVSMMVFVLLMLSTVTYDGFIETPFWYDIQGWILAARPLRPLLVALRDLTGDLAPVLASAALFVFPLIFLGAYLLFSRGMAAVAPAGRPAGELARYFVLSLVPIAIAYHLAHYLWYLLVAGQFMIPLASDPFGYGWDLFETARYRVDVGIVGPRFVWYASVAAIVVGHVIAVHLAHRTALSIYPSKGAALRSQYPMLALMVGYTMTSLWILAQPVVESRPGG